MASDSCLLRLRREEILPPLQEFAVIPLHLERTPRIRRIQLRHMGSDVLQKVPVVGHHQAGVRARQRSLEPEDAVQVQLIGRLVEQQQVRRLHQRGGDRQPHPPPAGELRRGRIRVPESGPPQHHLDASRLLRFFQVQTVQGRRQHGTHSVIRPKQRFLGDIGHLRLLSQGPYSGIRRFVSGQDLEQGGLAAAIGPDQAGPLSVGNTQRKILEQDSCAKRLAETGATQENGHVLPG